MSRFYGSLCINCDKASYHGVVSASGCPAINEAADVPVDGVDVGPWASHVVHEAGDCFAFRRQAVDSYLSGVPQLVTVGVVTGKINQKIGVVPFLKFANKEPHPVHRLVG